MVSYVVLPEDSALDNFDPFHLKDLTDVILFGNRPVAANVGALMRLVPQRAV